MPGRRASGCWGRRCLARLLRWGCAGRPRPLHATGSRPLQAAGSGPIFEAIVLDADTGQVLGENNADAITYPASLTKMMTLYLTFEALNSGRLRLDTELPVSAYAASRAPCGWASRRARRCRCAT